MVRSVLPLRRVLQWSIAVQLSHVERQHVLLLITTVLHHFSKEMDQCNPNICIICFFLLLSTSLWQY